MTDEELIAHLRLQGLDKDVAAADRIEQLVKQKDAKTTSAAWAEVLRKTYQRAKTAENKLAKAKAVLTSLANMKTAGDGKGAVAMAWHAREVLTELEKDT